MVYDRKLKIMSEWIKKNTVISCWIMFAILILVHGFEAIVLRTDEMMIVRVIIAQLISFGAVLIIWIKKEKKKTVDMAGL